MIKAVIFDLDGTLYDYNTLDKEAFGRVGELVRERLGVSEEQYGEAFMRARKSTKKKLGETAAFPQQNVVLPEDAGISGYQTALSCA